MSLVHCRMFSSTPGLSPPDACRDPRAVATRTPDIANCSSGGLGLVKYSPVENHCLRFTATLVVAPNPKCQPSSWLQTSRNSRMILNRLVQGRYPPPGLSFPLYRLRPLLAQLLAIRTWGGFGAGMHGPSCCDGGRGRWDPGEGQGGVGWEPREEGACPFESCGSHSGFHYQAG